MKWGAHTDIYVRGALLLKGSQNDSVSEHEYTSKESHKQSWKSCMLFQLAVTD